MGSLSMKFFIVTLAIVAASACGICVYNGMGFINEDGWPSIPRINEYLGSVVEGAEFNQCFCNALNADVEQLLEDGAQWAEEVGEAGEYFESSMRAEKLERFDLEWISQMVDLTSLPEEYANLDDQNRKLVEARIKFAVFNHCLDAMWMENCVA